MHVSAKWPRLPHLERNVREESRQKEALLVASTLPKRHGSSSLCFKREKVCLPAYQPVTRMICANQNILHGDPFPDGGFYVPDVKIPKRLCLILSWVSCLDGICAGKRETLIRVSILGRCGSPFAQRTSPLRNEFQTSVPAETSTGKSQQLFLSIPCFRI